MAAVVTPCSAARSRSGRMTISGRSRLAVDVMPARPSISRSCRSTARALAVKAAALSLARMICRRSLGPPLLIEKRAPGTVRSCSRIELSTSRCEGRSPRGASATVRDARRTSPACMPLMPAACADPAVTKTRSTPSMPTMAILAASAACRVSSRELAGGSSTLMFEKLPLGGGMNPIGSIGTSASDPARNTVAPAMVVLRCARHQRTSARYPCITRPSLCGLVGWGLRK